MGFGVVSECLESTNGVLIEADAGGVWLFHGEYFLISETLSFYSSSLPTLPSSFFLFLEYYKKKKAKNLYHVFYIILGSDDRASNFMFYVSNQF